MENIQQHENRKSRYLYGVPQTAKNRWAETSELFSLGEGEGKIKECEWCIYEN